MRLLVLLCLLILAPGLSAQGIEFFHGSWEEALAVAQAEDKPIFVDAYASWCGPCKRMSAQVFPQPEVGEVFNASFISLKLDMEKPEAATFRVDHPVRAYPTLFFLNPKGETIHTVVGGQQVEGLIAHARTALQKVDDVSQYEADYQAGKRDPDFVFRYVRALVRQGEPHLKIANNQLREQADNLTDPGNLRLILQSATDADSRIFDLLIEHRAAISELVSAEAVGKQIDLAFANTLAKAIEFQDEDLLENAAKKYDRFDDAKATAFRLEGGLAFAAAGNDPKAYYKAAKDYYKKVAAGDGGKLTQLFGDMSTSSFTKDKKVFDLTAQVGTEAAELSNDYQRYYRLATWFQEKGANTEALDAAQRSKSLIPEDKPNLHNLLDFLIKKIQDAR